MRGHQSYTQTEIDFIGSHYFRSAIVGRFSCFDVAHFSLISSSYWGLLCGAVLGTFACFGMRLSYTYYSFEMLKYLAIERWTVSVWCYWYNFLSIHGCLLSYFLYSILFRFTIILTFPSSFVCVRMLLFTHFPCTTIYYSVAAWILELMDWKRLYKSVLCPFYGVKPYE